MPTDGGKFETLAENLNIKILSKETGKLRQHRKIRDWIVKGARVTFDCKGDQVLICSRHENTRLARVFKHWIEDIVNFHATVSLLSHYNMVDISCSLNGFSHDDVARAKDWFPFFLKSFSKKRNTGKFGMFNI